MQWLTWSCSRPSINQHYKIHLGGEEWSMNTHFLVHVSHQEASVGSQKAIEQEKYTQLTKLGKKKHPKYKPHLCTSLQAKTDVSSN